MSPRVDRRIAIRFVLAECAQAISGLIATVVFKIPLHSNSVYEIKGDVVALCSHLRYNYTDHFAAHKLEPCNGIMSCAYCATLQLPKCLHSAYLAVIYYLSLWHYLQQESFYKLQSIGPVERALVVVRFL